MLLKLWFFNKSAIKTEIPRIDHYSDVFFADLTSDRDWNVLKEICLNYKCKFNVIIKNRHNIVAKNYKKKWFNWKYHESAIDIHLICLILRLICIISLGIDRKSGVKVFCFGWLVDDFIWKHTRTSLSDL